MHNKYQISNRSRFLTKSKYQISRGFSTLLIIVAVAIVGAAAVVAFGVLDVAKIKKPPVVTVTGSDEQLESLQTFSTSDEVIDIERDLGATDLDAVDNELDQVDRDLGSL